MTSIANDIPLPLGSVRSESFAPWSASLRRHGFIIPSFLVVMGVCFWFATWGDGRLFEPERFTGFYDAQARAMLHGRVDVPPHAIGFEAFLRDGKSYGYFGIAPALLRLPLVSVLPHMDRRWSRGFMLLACAINLLCAYRLVRKLRGPDRCETPAGKIILSLFVLCAGIGSTNVFLLSRSYTYHEAIMWGSTFALLFVDCLLTYLAAPTLRRLGAMGLFAFLSFHSRPTGGAGALLAMSIVTLILLYRAWGSRLSRGTGGPPMITAQKPMGGPPMPQTASAQADPTINIFQHALLAGLAVVFTVGVYFSINYAKFRTFDGVPVRLYGLYIKDPQRMAVTGGKQFHPENLATCWIAYFGAAGLQVSDEFPWIYMTRGLRVIGSPAIDVVEPHSSIPLSMPALFFLCLLGCRGILKGRTVVFRQLRLPVVALLLGGATVLFTVGITERYLHDFYPLLIVLGAAGTAYLMDQPNAGRRIPTLALLAAISIWVNCSFALEFQREIVWGVPAEKREQLVHARQTVDRFFHRTPIAAARE